MISQSESHLQEMWGLPGMLFNRDYDWLVSPGLYVPICMTYALAAYVARIRMRSRPEQSSATGEVISAAAAASSARKKLTLSTQHQHGGSSSSSSSSGSSEIPDGLLLRTAMQVYNLTQVVVCGYMMMGMGRVWWDGLAERPNLIGFFAAAHGRRGDVEHFIFIHYLSKYLDVSFFFLFFFFFVFGLLVFLFFGEILVREALLGICCALYPILMTGLVSLLTPSLIPHL